MSNLTKETQALTEKRYEEKCTHPSAEDIRNCLYDMRDDKDKQDDWVSSIQRLWNQNDTVFGAMIRAKFKQSFLEVGDIEALEELGVYWEHCQQALKSNERAQ